MQKFFNYVYFLDPNDRDKILLAMSEDQYKALPLATRATLEENAPSGGLEYGPSPLQDADDDRLRDGERKVKTALIPEGQEQEVVSKAITYLIPLLKRVRPSWLALLLTALAGAVGTAWPIIVSLFN